MGSAGRRAARIIRAQPDRARAGHVHGAAHRPRHGRHQRVEPVLLVHELDARIEAQVGRARGQRQVARDLRGQLTGRSPAGSAASCRSRSGGGASRSRSSSRSRPRRAGSASAAGTGASCPRRRTGARVAPRRRCPADPRTTIVRTVGAFSSAASSWSEPITFMSCIACGDMPGPRLPHDLVVHDGVHLERRRSASRSPGCGCRRRSARCARAPAAASACRARPRARRRGRARAARPGRAPRWLPTPVISTRRPGISRALGGWLALARALRGARLAGSRSSIASSRRPMARNSAFSSRMSS